MSTPVAAPVDPRIGQQTASNGATIVTSFGRDGTIVTNGPITAQTNPNPNVRVGYGIGKIHCVQ